MNPYESPNETPGPLEEGQTTPTDLSGFAVTAIMIAFVIAFVILLSLITWLLSPLS